MVFGKRGLFFRGKGVRILSDHQLFIRGDDEDTNGGIGRGDVEFFSANTAIFFHVDFVTDVLEVGTHAFAHDIAVFANAGGEDKRVDIADGSRVGANIFFDAVAVHFEGEGRSRIAFVGCLFDRAHVVGQTRDTEHAALFVEQVVDLCDGHVFDTGEKSDDGGVDIAASGAHDEPFQGGKPHGGIDGFAVLDGRHARAVSEMRGDEIRFL